MLNDFKSMESEEYSIVVAGDGIERSRRGGVLEAQ